jgi:hypothetical protein
MPSRTRIALTSLTEPLKGVVGLAMLFFKRESNHEEINFRYTPQNFLAQHKP